MLSGASFHGGSTDIGMTISHSTRRRVQQPTPLSEASVTLLIINAVAPLVYAYGSMRGFDMAEKSARHPFDAAGWKQHHHKRMGALSGMRASDALRSQALIHLRKEYCDTRKCLYCRFGHLLLRKAVAAD